MKDTIAVYALWRDSEAHIERTLHQLEDLENLNYNFEYYFYENDSKDNTVNILTKWLDKRSGKFLHENIGAKKFGSVINKERMLLLSDCRTKCKNLGKESSAKYALCLDSDIIFDKNNLEMHISDLEKLPNCAMVTPNVRQDIPDLISGESKDSYYDILPFYDRFKVSGLPWANCPFRNGIDKMFWGMGKPVKCFSAFGGFALIKGDIYKKVNWSSTGLVDHINLCQEINDFGDIYVCPKNKVKAVFTVTDKQIQNFKQTSIKVFNNPITFNQEIFTPKDYSDLNKINCIKAKTKLIKKLLSKKECDQTKKIEFLKDTYKGQDCYILLTGPSFKDYKKDFLKNKLKDKLVFCVKQSFEDLEEICDFHFWNCSNLPFGSLGVPYKYKNNKPIIVASSNYPLGVRWNKQQEIDFFCKIPMLEEVGKENCLAVKRNYNDYIFSKTHQTTVGPGIMLETVLNFALHLGVSNIYTLGWDLDSHGSHFYKEDQVDNKGCEIPWDIEANAAAVDSIVDWLKSHSINLKTISKSSKISEKVKRVEL